MTRPIGFWKQALGLVAWLAVTYAAAAAGALASADAPDFYRRLVLPAWAPPAGLFGPVWSFLYTLMGIAAWLVWKTGGWRAAAPALALALFLVQLGANALWSWLFFRWRLGAAASVEIVVLWGLIAGTLAAFWRLRRLAGILLLPYLLWVGFACALTWAVWRRNPQLLG